MGGADAAGLPARPAGPGVRAGHRRRDDDAQLVERLGHAVHVVMGDPRNIKITTPGDLALAEAVIDSLPKPKTKITGPFDEAQW